MYTKLTTKTNPITLSQMMNGDAPVAGFVFWVIGW
jgi:hypothetical protein